MTARTVLVTGGTGGIGTAICKRLADAGHRVATNYRNEEKSRAWQAAMKAQGYDFMIAKGDVTSPDEAAVMVGEVEKALGPVDILVNNAGITRDGTFHRMSADQWNDVINTNLNSCFNVTRPVIEGMRERKWGRIIQISSINGLKGQYGQANYAAAKAGIIGFSKSLAKEIGSRGVTVNVVAPGFIETDMTRDLPESAREAMLGQIALGRLGTPQDIAEAVLFLASPAAAYITGETLHVNGGMYMP